VIDAIAIDEERYASADHGRGIAGLHGDAEGILAAVPVGIFLLELACDPQVSSQVTGYFSPTLSSQLLRTPRPVMVRWKGICSMRPFAVEAAMSPGAM
jgi:hypothetical protein